MLSFSDEKGGFYVGQNFNYFRQLWCYIIFDVFEFLLFLFFIERIDKQLAFKIGRPYYKDFQILLFYM